MVIRPNAGCGQAVGQGGEEVKSGKGREMDTARWREGANAWAAGPGCMNYGPFMRRSDKQMQKVTAGLWAMKTSASTVSQGE